MKHRKSGFKLNRSRPHRRALLRNLATSLILHGQVKTTVTKAKFLRGFVDRLIVKAKSNTLSARRYLLANLFSKKAVNKVMHEIITKLNMDNAQGAKNSGFCKIYKLHWRPGDCADMALVRLEV